MPQQNGVAAMDSDFFPTDIRAFQQACKVCFWSLDLETGRVHSALDWREWLGLEQVPEDLAGWLELLHPTDRVSVERLLADSSQAGGPALEARLRHCNGEWRWFRFKGGVYAGRWTGLVEQLQLSQHEELYRSLYEHTTEHLFSLSVDEHGVFRYEGLNPAHQRATGLREEDLKGKRPDECLPLEVAEHVLRNYRRCLQSGRPISYEEDLFLPKGMISWLTQLIPLRNEKGRIWRILGICTDLTRLKGQEQALRLAQRQESIGRLTAGIAHDFNNLLTVIICQLDLMELEMTQNPDMAEALGEIGEAARRAAELTRGLLRYGRGDSKPRAHSLASLVSDFQRVLRNVVHSKVKLVFHLESQGAVKIAPVSVDQLLLNLVGNASEAIGPRGGRIDVRVSELGLTAEAARCLLPHQSLKEGRYVTLEVVDDGPGVDPELVDCLFEAGISSKGEGRGLGLATVRDIVSALEGGLLVQSEHTRGTTFKLFFPMVPAEPEWPLQPSASPLTRSGHVLVCSEELGMRRILRELCEQVGFQAQEASSPAELLTLLAQQRDCFDLLVLDVVDRWTQDQVMAALPALGPTPPVLLTSDLPAGDLLLNNDYAAPAGFLVKPFERLQFEEAIGRLPTKGRAHS